MPSMAVDQLAGAVMSLPPQDSVSPGAVSFLPLNASSRITSTFIYQIFAYLNRLEINRPSHLQHSHEEATFQTLDHSADSHGD